MPRSLLALLLALGTLAPAHAQAPQAALPQGDFPAGAQVAYVNVQVVLSQSKLGQAGSARLRALTDEAEAEIETREQEIADLRARIDGPDRQTRTMVEHSALLSELSRREAQLNFDRESWQIRLEQFSEELLQDFREQLLPAVEAVREARGVLLVLSVPDSGILAVDPRLDLSAEVIRQLDERAGR